MDAKQFYAAFQKEIEANREELFRHYTQDKRFTKDIMALINGIIKSAGCKAQNEYYRIDAIGWVEHERLKEMKKMAVAEKIGLNAHLWKLMIAVEHENNSKDWTDELIKLIHVKCPLKVIIGYTPCDLRGEEEKRKLAFAAKWMQEFNALQMDTEEYLIILGNGAPSSLNHDGYTDFGYAGYLYNADLKRFELLN